MAGTIKIFAINTGYSLINLMLIGAIVGAWKKTPPRDNREFIMN